MQQKEQGPTTVALVASIDTARAKAEEVDREYIGTEHLLLGLLENENSTATALLRRLGVDLNALKTAAEELGPPAAAPWGTTKRRSGVAPPKTEVPFTSKTQVAYRKALETAAEFGGTIGTGPMLVALHDPKCLSGALMVQAGITIEDTVAELRTMYDGNEEAFRTDNWAGTEGV